MEATQKIVEVIEQWIKEEMNLQNFATEAYAYTGKAITYKLADLAGVEVNIKVSLAKAVAIYYQKLVSEGEINEDVTYEAFQTAFYEGQSLEQIKELV